ncbi:hypothetical protein Hanom_Chr04g00384801 [Helianthus anomalus]
MKLPSTIVFLLLPTRFTLKILPPFSIHQIYVIISTQQPQMAFSCSGLTLKLHVLERPYCVQRWCDEKGTTNLSFLCLYIQIVKILEGSAEEGFTLNHSPPHR